jgi:preprotein translocase SecE subunit
MSEVEQQVAGAPGRIDAVRDFLIDTREEVEKVSWPTKPELIAATRAVVIGAVILGIAIGLVDTVLRLILVNGIGALAR